jgi:hypothetical protein
MLKSTFYSYTLLIFVSSISLIGYSQNSDNIYDAYKNYNEAPREVVYLHLNKSTYIKGESIGFTAYVMDKEDKTQALLTTNLYVSVSDGNDKVVKQKLIQVNNGIGSNTIALDSSFTSGIYHVKAYTNWMRNFNEPNYYSEAIKVIDPEVETYIKRTLVDNDIDAQFLPESGHLLHGILNNIGVVIKDSQGFGLANTKGEVINNNNEVLTTFETNKMGIGKFPLFANINNTYTIRINHANENFSFPLGHVVEKNGVILSVKRLKSKLFTSVITNEETLNLLRNKRHTLMLHNGKDYEIMDIYFTDATVITKAIEYANIPSGTNIVTLFDENEKPVAERLFFNYDAIDVLASSNLSSTRKSDSLIVKLSFKDIDPEAFNNISVSVLPQETESYNRHHNILSQTYIQPYVRGPVENAKYYFTDIDNKKRYELDNLLLTQGWSSYNWNNMFMPEQMPYAFEQGISLKANVNNQDHLQDVFVLHHFGDSPPRYKQVSEGNSSFIFENLFPNEENQILISRLREGNDLLPAQLYLQPVPQTIPYLRTFFRPLQPKTNYKVSEQLKIKEPIWQKLDGVQQLDEVVVMTKMDEIQLRTQKLNTKVYGQIKIPSDIEKLTFLFLEDYLRANRVGASFDPESGNMIFTNGRASGSLIGGSSMQVFFDGMPLTDTGFLYRYPIVDIDYIEINRGGLGEGARGANGVLRIYSSIKSLFNTTGKLNAQDYELPLSFSSEKTFYVPKYKYYNDDFYKEYGTIDWKPQLSMDSQGNVSITVAQPQVPITLFIEGVANNGAFIFEERSISIN